MRTLIVIPARLGSWRFPNKPLVDILGMPMIEHVYRRAKMVSNVNEVVIATCDDEVRIAAEKFGAEVVMTSKECPTACERVGEAAKIKGYIKSDDIVINVQGDEPIVPPEVIELTRKRLLESETHLVANLVEKLHDEKALKNPHRVKACLTRNNNMLFLSREAIPSKIFDVNNSAQMYLLTCITAYRGTFLEMYGKLPRTHIELVEGNDMMRVLEHEIKIPSGVSPYRTHPVDMPEDVPEIVEILKDDPIFSRYRHT